MINVSNVKRELGIKFNIKEMPLNKHNSTCENNKKNIIVISCVSCIIAILIICILFMVLKEKNNVKKECCREVRNEDNDVVNKDVLEQSINNAFDDFNKAFVMNEPECNNQGIIIITQFETNDNEEPKDMKNKVEEISSRSLLDKKNKFIENVHSEYSNKELLSVDEI